MNREDYPVRVLRKGEETDDLLATTTAGERMAMVWELTVQAWAFMGENIRESRLPRHVVRVIRRNR